MWESWKHSDENVVEERVGTFEQETKANICSLQLISVFFSFQKSFILEH